MFELLRKVWRALGDLWNRLLGRHPELTSASSPDPAATIAAGADTQRRQELPRPADTVPREGATAAPGETLPRADATLVRDLVGTITTSGSAGWAEGLDVGGFVVERVLGEGGMGKVFLLTSKETAAQFAVKTLKAEPGRDARVEQELLRELQLWMNLPPLDQLVACRFFRSIGGELAIFAECVRGGSLSSWISGGRLTAIDPILDVAIQTAWGLHVAHECGLVHQDMKPANVLMTEDGVAKVSDFGLAVISNRAAGGAPSSGVTVRGHTPMYCSPEQASGEKITRSSDLWSWGLCVLEMFTGDATWSHGAVAPDALDEYLSTAPAARRGPAMPEALVRLLRRCFQLDPAGRWPTLAPVVDALREIYAAECGRPYPRSLHTPAKREGVNAGAFADRWTAGGVQWDDPMHWLSFVHRESMAVKSARDALLMLADDVGLVADRSEAMTRDANLVSDLMLYERVFHEFKSVLPQGRADLRFVFANMCQEKAFVHRALGDLEGALRLYDEADLVYKALLEEEGNSWNLLQRLLGSQSNRSHVLRSAGNLEAALALQLKNEQLVEPLIERERDAESARQMKVWLGQAVMARAHELRFQNIPEAIALSRKGLAHLEDGRADVLKLSMAYSNLLRLLVPVSGATDEAITLSRKCLVLLRGLHGGAREQMALGGTPARVARTLLCGALSLEAMIQRKLGKPEVAILRLDEAVGLYTATEQDPSDIQGSSALAKVLGEKAELTGGPPALALYDRAEALFQRCFDASGSLDALTQVVETRCHRAGSLVRANRVRDGIEALRSATVGIKTTALWGTGSGVTLLVKAHTGFWLTLSLETASEAGLPFLRESLADLDSALTRGTESEITAVMVMGGVAMLGTVLDPASRGASADDMKRIKLEVKNVLARAIERVGPIVMSQSGTFQLLGYTLAVFRLVYLSAQVGDFATAQSSAWDLHGLLVRLQGAGLQLGRADWVEMAGKLSEEPLLQAIWSGKDLAKLMRPKPESDAGSDPTASIERCLGRVKKTRMESPMGVMVAYEGPDVALKDLAEAYLARMQAHVRAKRSREALQDAEELQFLLFNMEGNVTDPAVQAFVKATLGDPLVQQLFSRI